MTLWWVLGRPKNWARKRNKTSFHISKVVKLFLSSYDLAILTPIWLKLKKKEVDSSYWRKSIWNAFCLVGFTFEYVFRLNRDTEEAKEGFQQVFFLILQPDVSYCDGYKARWINQTSLVVMFQTLKLLFASFLPWSSTPSSPFAVYQRGKFSINKLTVGISFVLCVNLLFAAIPLKCIDFSQSANSSAKEDPVHKKHVWRRLWPRLSLKQRSQFSKTRDKRRQSTDSSYGIMMYECHSQTSEAAQSSCLLR